MPGPQRPREPISVSKIPGRAPPSRPDRIDGPGRRRRRQRRHGIVLRASPEQRPRPAPMEHPATAADRDHHLDRAHLSPPSRPDPPWPVDPHRIRDNHDHTAGPSRLTTAVTKTCSSPDAVLKFYDSWNRGEIDFDQLVDENIVNHQPD